MAAAAMPDLVVDDIDLGFLDGLDFDLGSFDDLAEFCHGDAVGAAADGDDKKGGLGLCLSDSDDDESDDDGSDGGTREGSPDSVVTDDYGEVPLSSTGPGDLDLDGGDSMSAYVSELERFLMEDDDEDQAGGRAMTTTEGEIAADEHKYFFGHLLVEDDGCVGLAAGAGAEEEDEEDVAAREDEATSRKRARSYGAGRVKALCLPQVHPEIRIFEDFNLSDGRSSQANPSET
ncbi:uncharacterized protein LOC100832609 isoform X3 [Brachypodium distachyon]|uniref:uncharacterized protein LOC100832609 isoform X3 n=1 Tax=Brachypodium distachyon TaxID=15368 RepID=UPI000D0CEDEE|nr:uncharacterized protein LOC100832609 isoform X3 [Brachypodium distachyon]XP_024311544.1 uncharacterized protein LOC100832609 isoform X3 [Brachypodium distachyon]XP_024311545.1 uncharacterized protein LOC100832609 isoform X3 [Brachypodium distachyon]XP_024311546.1 uncharacterized protein LOC100832609 isoform X3 [Brachypodium distachyon]XP_024311547.1 uncharacterized protein LOC100832609 isoform X3 [Brachypodium distachyon]|eukprot:XP_024311543.1 uncharacterized protein LOC100832609 isoform X3 [Brachypodium distachyon]